MKSLLKVLSIFSVLVSTSCMAFAAVTPYVGAEYQWRTTNLRGLGTHFPRSCASTAFVGGIKFENRIGLEVGTYFLKKNKDDFLRAIRSKGLHLSITAFHPLNDNETVRLIGSAGFGHIKHSFRGIVTNVKSLYNGEIKYSRIAPRFSAGFEFNLMENLVLRTTGIWESAYSMKHVGHKIHPNYSASSGLIVLF